MRIYSLRALSCFVPLVVALGCAPVPPPAAGLHVHLLNQSAVQAEVAFEVDGETLRIPADSGQEVSDALTDCPESLVLVEVVLSAEAESASNLITDGELTAGRNFVCGDTVFIIILDDEVRLTTTSAD